jgi:hypothetical protein
MTDLEKEKRKGEHAGRLLQDELLNEILDDLEKQIITKWEATPARDKEAREELWLFFVAAKRLRNTLRSCFETGEMAKVQIERSIGEKVVNFFRG